MTSLPSTTWRMLAYGSGGKPLPRGLDAAWDVAAGYTARLVPRTKIFTQQAQLVLAAEKTYAEMTDAKLKEQILQTRALFLRGREEKADLIRAFGIVREVASRVLGQKPFGVQVTGALIIEAGCIAEMATGEGKTLTATMPAVVAGWRGRGCHVITFNDYLAKRDAEWMAQVYRFCGLRVGYVDGEMAPADRRDAYLADVTYCSNKEVAADFLRDRLSLGPMKNLTSALLAKLTEGGGTDKMVMRGLHRAIIDEADSNLIDEAVTPLIISGNAPNPDQVEAFEQAATMAKRLHPPEHYTINQRYHEVDLTPAGKGRLGELAEALGGRWSSIRWREERITQALTAHEFYRNGKQYLIDDGKVVIVDEFTGRPMPDREWRDGLHQAVEAKESLEVNPPKDTYARISFQRFFRLYRTLSGMTGTAAEAKSEFWQIYHMPVAVIPTNKPCIRKKLPDRVFATNDAKWEAVAQEIRRVHNTGRPVLIGTRSVGASEHLSRLLTSKELEHRILNAVNISSEAEIIAGAGQPSRITVATNMAGRGTDIQLGRGVAEKGGLHVIATERHEAGRIDRQLYGRSGRQGDPGSSQAFVSFEDELPRRHASHLCRILANRYGKIDGPIESKLASKLFDLAQRKAERTSLAQRKGVLRTDFWLDENLGFAGKEG